MCSASRPTGWIANAPSGGACSTSSTSTSRRKRPNEHATDRFAPGVGDRAPGTAGEGEGTYPGPRCTSCRAPPDAEDGRGEGLSLRGPGRPEEPARPVRGAPPTDPL